MSLGGLHKLAGQRIGDELAGFGDAVESDEGAEAGALLCPEQHAIDGAEPVAQRLEAVRLADLVDEVLQVLGVARAFLRRELVGEILKGGGEPYSSIRKEVSTATGLVAYNLEPVARLLVPVFSPLRNRIPRVALQ